MSRGRFTQNESQKTDVEGAGAGTPYVTLAANGTWGGGTLRLEAGYYSDALKAFFWVPVPDALLTANGLVTIAINAHELRVTLTGATAPALDWAIV